MSKYLTLFLLCMIPAPQSSFRELQRHYNRVDKAYLEKEGVVKSFFAANNIQSQGFDLFIRAFKKEMMLEAWVKPRGKEQFLMLQSYKFCASSGTAGPKRKEGDLQIPEGIYYINHFNPLSKFHLSLGINYPNDADRILSDKLKPGGEIYIHGDCVTVGCIPITDDKIKELYLLAVEAKNGGQEKIPVHIFPAKLTKEKLADLRRETNASETLSSFWQNLKMIYDGFETSRKLKPVHVNSMGEYMY